ncbi:STAS domain-containing protein [Nonomuraea typhae]|uniref:STAS domain-containing protein n=1 Tax=Nonomuraea typhae TaxID=2603600 RepID=A0ABW7Z6T2_9ACTN
MLDKTPLSVEVATPSPGTVRLSLTGDLAFESAGKLAALSFTSGYRRLDLDLAGLSFIDSSGLAALVRLHQRAESDGAALRLVAVSPHLRRLLKVTALDRLFRLP